MNGAGKRLAYIDHLSAEIARRDELLLAMALLLHQARPMPMLADYGLPDSHFSRQEMDVLRALMPPGTVVGEDRLFRRAFGHLLYEGAELHDLRQAACTVTSRLRGKLWELGWTLPFKSAAGYCVLEPGRPLPEGYVPFKPLQGLIGHRAAVQPDRARAVIDLLRSGVSCAAAQARTRVGRDVVQALRDGRHWTQREGLVPRLDPDRARRAS